MTDETSLDNFVAETIKGVISGVIKSQEYAKEVDAYVNPLESDMDGGRARVQMAEYLEFDLAVSGTTLDRESGGIQVLLGIVGGGGERETQDVKEIANRVRFKVRVTYPIMYTGGSY